jgi:CubicO group peptidase (beta-lactamase class C family)
MRMTSRFPVVLLAMLALVAIAATGRAAEPPRPDAIPPGDFSWPIAHARWRIAELVADDQVAGMSVALIDGDRIVWAQGFGRATPDVPASEQTAFRVGGMSALPTILAALRLADAGRLDLDASVADVLPGFRVPKRFPEARAITIRDLMTHRSGLPPDHMAGAVARSPAPWASVLDLIAVTQPVAPPGTRSQESALGITVLALAVQQAAGAPFESHVQDAMLKPLGMATARYDTGARPAPGDAVAFREGKPRPHLGVRNVPALGLHASVTDLARILRFLFGAPDATTAVGLRNDTRASIWRVQNAEVAQDLGFPVGLGFVLAGFGPLGLVGAGPVAIASAGGDPMPGVMAALPQHGLGVVVLSNTAEASQVVNRVAGELLANALDAKAGIRQPEIPDFPYADPPWPRDRLAAFAGSWATLMGLVRVEVRGSHLRVKALGKTFRLVPRTDGLLHLEYRLLGLFRIDLKGLGALGFSMVTVEGRDHLVLHQSTTRVPFGVRVEPGPLPASWAARLGRYRLDNRGDAPAPFTRVRLKRQDGLLTAELRLRDMGGMTVSLVLRPDGDDQALFDGVGPGAGGVLEARDDDGTVLLHSGWRFVRTGD